MKRPFSWFLLSLVGLLAGTVISALPASAAEATSGDFTYDLDSETLNGYLTGYTGTDSEITLPSELDGTPITGIAADTFYDCDQLEKVTIPASITEIGESVFFDCNNLKEFAVEEGNDTFYTENGVLFRHGDEGDTLMAYPPAATATTYTVPDNVVELYYAAFAKCTNLTEIQLPENLLYIDDWVFAYDVISDITLPESVIEICDYAFAYCENITQWKLPENLTYIGSAAFANCTGMAEMILPLHLTEIGQAAFVGTGLTEITIPPSVEKIGYCALGYENDMTTPVKGFVIYGQANTAAQTYASDTDEENAYSNSFTFVTVQDATVVRGGKNEDAVGISDNVVITEKQEKSFNSKWILLGISAVVLIVGGILIVMGLRSDKKKGGTTASETKQKTEQKTEESE